MDLASILNRIAENLSEASSQPAVSAFDLETQRATTWSYGEIGHLVQQVTDSLRDLRGQPIGVLSQKNGEAYAALMAILFSGNHFVPLNPKFPYERLKTICRLAGVQTILADERTLRLDGRFAELSSSVHVLKRNSREAFRAESLLAVSDQALAYIMFTSGSTGEPKGVMISRASLASVSAEISGFYPASRADRFAQVFESSFDLSIGEILWSFMVGGVLCPLDSLEVTNFAQFANREQITIMGMAPSVLQLVTQASAAQGRTFPKLKFSLFCGEKLNVRLVEQWRRLAPASSINNLYGPTEATLYVTRHLWDGQSQNGFDSVPLGEVFAGHRLRLVNEDLTLSAAGEAGEILLSGPQVSLGYLNDPLKTGEAFVHPPWDHVGRWYRTGDLATFSQAGTLHYIGRRDLQIKVLGQRVETGEIESLLQAALPCEWVVLPWPRNSLGQITGVVAVTRTEVETAALKEARLSLIRQLPQALVPSEFYRCVGAFPLTPHGKLDRRQLEAELASLKLTRLYP